MAIILQILFGLVVLYLLSMLVLLRLVVPFMGFRMYRIPTEIPNEYRRLISEWEGKSLSQYDYLKQAYDFTTQNWKVEKFKAVTEFPKIFRRDLKGIWGDKGYIHCNTMVYVLGTFLVNSRFFKPEDIQVRHTLLNLVLHQYMKVRVGRQWLDVDPAGAYVRGKALGERCGIY
jgi:hypothetical protein